jgi:hypothetical protein
MSSPAPDGPTPTGRILLLERITAGVLLLVIAMLGWIVLAALNEWNSSAGQVAAVVVILTAALVLVSVLALLQTR